MAIFYGWRFGGSFLVDAIVDAIVTVDTIDMVDACMVNT